MKTDYQFLKIVCCKKSYPAKGYNVHTNEIISEEWITKNKCYKLVLKNETEYIIDNDKEFNSTLTIPKIFEKFFYTDQQFRKQKLQKLNQTR